MSAAVSNIAGLIDLVGRIMLTHVIAPEHVERVIGCDRSAAEAIISTGRLAARLDPERLDRLSVFASILVRLEWRLQHDSLAIRHALEAPVTTLGGIAPAVLLGGSLEDLHAFRRSIETMEAPKVKWWRVGH